MDLKITGQHRIDKGEWIKLGYNSETKFIETYELFGLTEPSDWNEPKYSFN